MTDDVAEPSGGAEIGEILFREEEIRSIVDRLAQEIDEDYADRSGDLVLLGVLKSCLHFLSDLSRALTTPHLIDLVSVKSYYGGTESSGQVRIARPPELDLAGRPVLVVEDVYDSGRTLSRVLEYVAQLAPASLASCVLFSKPEAHVVPIAVDYTGVEIPNRFIIGYGLDYDERHRDLPYVAVKA